MPKIKSHSGAKKRFKRTRRGKWLAKPAALRHLMAGKSAKIGRRKRRSKTLGKHESKFLDTYLPYA